MSSSVPPPFQPSNPPPSDPFASSHPPLPPGKKSNLLTWILGGIVTLMIGVLGTCGLAYYFIMHKAKEAGFDSGLLTTNPGYAAAKMFTTMNPDVETITSDDSSGTITVRDKKSGKTTTLKFDPNKKTMVVIDENGKEGSAQMPGWMPVYPGSSPTGTFSSQSKDGNQS